MSEHLLRLESRDGDQATIPLSTFLGSHPEDYSVRAAGVVTLLNAVDGPVEVDGHAADVADCFGSIVFDLVPFETFVRAEVKWRDE